MKSKHRIGIILLAAGALVTPVWKLAVAQAPNYQAAHMSTIPNFEIERMDPADLTNTYVAMTFDSQGRLFVSKEGDHPRWLLDNDGDGIYEAEKIFTDQVENCQGLWWDGTTLYGNCMPSHPEAEEQQPQQGGGFGGNGPRENAGLYRITDSNGDDVADSVEKVFDLDGRVQEHGPHAIRRGPDGQIYTIMGNFATFTDDDLAMTSPLFKNGEDQLLPVVVDWNSSNRQSVHSAVYRYDPGSDQASVYFGGMRNSYDFSFNIAGEIFLFDSDMEWDVGLPWYRDVRTVHGIPGGNFGYRDNSGKLPPWEIDTLPPVRDLGRGSPVGVENYQSYAYPPEFYDMLLEADWSRGRLLYTPLTPNGATYTARSDRAEFVHGEPLNITDVEVGPDGLVWMTLGGRNTAGGVYRVNYHGYLPPREEPTGVLAIVRQAQPLSSWGWAAIEQAKSEMGDQWSSQMEDLARDTSADSTDRFRAVLELQRHGPAPSDAMLVALASDDSADLRAAVVYVAGLHDSDTAKAIAAGALDDDNALVRRRASEALRRQGLSPDQPSFAPVENIYAQLNDSDRFVRWSGRLALEQTPRSEWIGDVLNETNPLGAIEGMVAAVRTMNAPSDLEDLFEKQLSMMQDFDDLSPDNQLRLLRAFELTAIRTPDGVSAERRKQVSDLIIGQFPNQDDRLNRELAATLAYAGQPEAFTKIVNDMTGSRDRQKLEIYYAYALSRMPVSGTATEKQKLADWFSAATSFRGGNSFTRYQNRIFVDTLDKWSDADKQMAYNKVPQYAPVSEEELAAIQAGRGGRGGRGGQAALGGVVRGTGELTKEEMFEEVVFTPMRGGGGRGGQSESPQATFEANCASCHSFGAIGNEVGPDLTTIAARFRPRDVAEAIIWPSRTVSSQYQSEIIMTQDGDVYNGIVTDETDDQVFVRTAELDRSIPIAKANIDMRRASDLSLMPDGLDVTLGEGGMRNLINWLLTATPPTE